jgi:NADH-quinone oxidoreductase subunit H
LVLEYLNDFFELFLYPGFSFLFLLAFLVEWLDRKIVAKFQNRFGPYNVGYKGILQPIADFIKLLSKEDITPQMTDKLPFKMIPILILSLAITPLFNIPISSFKAVISFEGDLIIVFFLMSLITFLISIGAWVSTSRFSMIGSLRAGLQMFGYEIPLFLAAIGPAIVSKSLSISGIVEWKSQEIWIIFTQPLGFAILTLCILAHIQRVPFDIPEAESEIVGGWLVEFSGKKLALIKLASNFELVLGGSLMVSLFLGGPSGLWNPHPLFYLIKLIFCIFILSNLRSLFARYRIDTFLDETWKLLTPLSLIQIIIVNLLTW